MFNNLKKAVYLGAGLAYQGAEAAGELARSIARDAEMSEEEGKKFVDEVVSRQKNMGNKLSDEIKSQVDTALSNFNVASRVEVMTEIQTLKDRVTEIEMSLVHLTNDVNKIMTKDKKPPAQ
ncbi:MAG: hypothetical protein GF398_10930 [Chitinivibrionales bacterium]|nr:hypothetical protein [Chitinivibrionales bacterium]